MNDATVAPHWLKLFPRIVHRHQSNCGYLSFPNVHKYVTVFRVCFFKKVKSRICVKITSNFVAYVVTLQHQKSNEFETKMVHVPSVLVGSVFAGSSFLVIHRDLSHRNRLSSRWIVQDVAEEKIQSIMQSLKSKNTPAQVSLLQREAWA